MEVLEDHVLLWLKSLSREGNSGAPVERFVAGLGKSKKFSNRMNYIRMEHSIQELKSELSVQNVEDVDLENDANLVRNYSRVMRLHKQVLLSRKYRANFVRRRAVQGAFRYQNADPGDPDHELKESNSPLTSAFAELTEALLDNSDLLDKAEARILDAHAKGYKAALLGESYADVCDHIDIDKNKLYSEDCFQALFRKVLVALVKSGKFEDFDVVADNLVKYELGDFFWRVFYEIIDSNYCRADSAANSRRKPNHRALGRIGHGPRPGRRRRAVQEPVPGHLEPGAVPPQARRRPQANPNHSVQRCPSQVSGLADDPQLRALRLKLLIQHFEVPGESLVAEDFSPDLFLDSSHAHESRILQNWLLRPESAFFALLNWAKADAEWPLGRLVGFFDYAHESKFNVTQLLSGFLGYISSLGSRGLDSFFGFVEETGARRVFVHYLAFLGELNGVDFGPDGDKPMECYVSLADMLNLGFLARLLRSPRLFGALSKHVHLVMQIFRIFLEQNTFVQDHKSDCSMILQLLSQEAVSEGVKRLLREEWDRVGAAPSNVRAHNVLVLNWLVLLSECEKYPLSDSYTADYDALGKIILTASAPFAL